LCQRERQGLNDTEKQKKRERHTEAYMDLGCVAGGVVSNFDVFSRAYVGFMEREKVKRERE
jgi:hypothetical protein